VLDAIRYASGKPCDSRIQQRNKSKYRSGDKLLCSLGRHSLPLVEGYW